MQISEKLKNSTNLKGEGMKKWQNTRFPENKVVLKRITQQLKREIYIIKNNQQIVECDQKV